MEEIEERIPVDSMLTIDDIHYADVTIVFAVSIEGLKNLMDRIVKVIGP